MVNATPTSFQRVHGHWEIIEPKTQCYFRFELRPAPRYEFVVESESRFRVSIMQAISFICIKGSPDLPYTELKHVAESPYYDAETVTPLGSRTFGRALISGNTIPALAPALISTSVE